MNKAKKNKMVAWVCVIIIEIVAVLLITKAIVTGSSPWTGILFLIVGLFFLLIAIKGKSENGKRDAN